MTTEEFVTRQEFNEDIKEIRKDLSELKIILAQQGANVWKYLSLSCLSFIAGIVTDIALKALHIG